MVTPLKKHQGNRAGLFAVMVLATGLVVVWAARSHRSAAHVPASPETKAISWLPATDDPSPPRTVAAKPAPAVAVDTSRPARIAATGPIAYVESRTSRITVPAYGFVRKLREHSLGRKIRAGETVATLYSPAVYLAAVDDLAELADFRSQDRLDAARVRLLRFGMRRDMLATIEQTRRPQLALPLIARVTGTVVAENGPRDALADPTAGTELLTITDPSYAVLYVDVPSADAARVELGMIGHVTIAGFAHPIDAPVGYVSRRDDDGKRTVRFDLHVAGAQLVPGAAATVELALPARSSR
jgi:Cu(I)/Ag(I) efflux system membrane fusion protein